MPSRYCSSFVCAIAASAYFVSARAPACSLVTRSNVVPCALAQSIETQSEREGLAAAQGRRQAASTLLPSNPSLSLSAGIPVGYELSSSTLTWGVTIAQELEIGGQRGRRLDVANAERSAHERRVLAIAREVGRQALNAYFDAVAAREQSILARKLGDVAEALSTYARSRSEVGLASPVESGVAQAEAVRLSRLELETELRLKETLATLASVLGQDPTQLPIEVSGDLEPLTIADTPAQRLVSAAIAERADVQTALAENEVAARRAALLRAARLPNPTISVSYRKDWIAERVVGVGLSFPIPLPAPLGRTFAGEIREADALTRRAKLETQRLSRDIRLEIVSAKLAFDSRKSELALFTPESVAQAEAGVDAIGEAIRGHKLGIRDALLSEQALVELLRDYIEARHRLCLASVELAHAMGLALERGVQ